MAGIAWVDPEMDCEIHGLSMDSRHVKPGDLFFAYPGEKADGRDFIQQALRAGASTILAESNDSYEWPVLPQGTIVLKTDNLQYKVSQIAARFYDHPSRQMNVVGVTGTNGKTSIAYLLATAFNHLEMKNACIYFGTLGTGFPDALQESTHTTLDPIHIQQYVANFLRKKVTHAALEISSHALDQGRVAHIEFKTAVFTNLTRDHLDYHKTMEAYGAAKAKLFKQFGLKSAVINLDDPFGFSLYQSLSEKIFRIGYSLDNPDADIYADHFLFSNQGIQANIKTPWGEGVLKTPLMGRFNLYNILAVLGVLGLSYSLDDILKCIETLPHVPGRVQCISSEKKDAPLMIVDYAHTPDALQNVLRTAKNIAEIMNGKLWCVFGCGGDRDKGKRPEMGKIAEQGADYMIVTNDNPRTEDDRTIANEIVQEISDQKNLMIILDREKAITHAFQQAKRNDVILIAGKGHESYQIMGTEKHYFSDEVVCRKLLCDGT